MGCEAALNAANPVSLTHRIHRFAAGARQIVGKPDS
jgi:hypothetical protein